MAAFLVAVQMPTASATWQFTFVNNSGKTVDMFFAAENSASGWGNNIFDTNPVHNGSSVGIKLGSDARYWKFKVIFQDGSSKYWTGVDMHKRWTKMIIKRDNQSKAGYSVVYN